MSSVELDAKSSDLASSTSSSEETCVNHLQLDPKKLAHREPQKKCDPLDKDPRTPTSSTAVVEQKKYPKVAGRTDLKIWKYVINSPESIRFADEPTHLNCEYPCFDDRRPRIPVIEASCETHMSHISYVYRTRVGRATICIARQHDLLFYARFGGSNGKTFVSKAYDRRDVFSFTSGPDPDYGMTIINGRIPPSWPTAEHEFATKKCLAMIPIVIAYDDDTVQLEFPNEGFDDWFRVRIVCVFGAREPEFPQLTGENVYDYEQSRKGLSS